MRIGLNEKAQWLKRRIRAQRIRWEYVPLAYLLLLVMFALWPGLFTSQDPYVMNLPNALAAVGSPGHLLGTDELGRDIASRIIYGARPTLFVAVFSLLFGAAVGTLIGLIAGILGGAVDAVLMRTADAFLSLPIILIALFLVMVLGPSMGNVILAIGILIWARYARIVRGETLKLRQLDFIGAAKVAGCSWLNIMYRHFLPNVMPTLLVLVTLMLGWVILIEATLSFLGAGIPPPTPAWGSMVADGRGLLTTAWWVSSFPGLVIMLLVLTLNTLGDQLRDAWDPKLRAL